MKHLLPLLILTGGTGLYVHTEQPKVWHQSVAFLGALPNEILPSVGPAASVSKPYRSFIPPDPLPARPNWTWTTLNGKTYEDVVVEKVEADCVTILHRDGGARIDISMLPGDIQQQLNYDPALAYAASEERAKEEAYSTEALSQENQQGEDVKQDRLAQLANNMTDPAPDSVRNDFGDRGSSSETGRVVNGEEYIGYEFDMGWTYTHLHFDPKTGQASGDPMYVRRYEEDRRMIAIHDRQLEEYAAREGEEYANRGREEYAANPGDPATLFHPTPQTSQSYRPAQFGSSAQLQRELPEEHRVIEERHYQPPANSPHEAVSTPRPRL
jgi:hypothetical protein